jgi:adiponectin receptor
MHYSSVPEWLHVPFIKTGYVYPGLTHSECSRLLFKWHNQTLNAWTMILGVFVSTYFYINSDMTLPFTILWLSCIFHMPFAVANHLFRHISREHYVYYKNLDMHLILISSVMLTFAFSYHVFSLEFTLLNTSIALISAFKTSKLTEIGSRTDKKKHVLMFLINVLSYLAPIVYKIQMCESQAILACIGCALMIYITGFPERIYPERFDIIGASHQWMHIFVLLAHVFEYYFVSASILGYKYK